MNVQSTPISWNLMVHKGDVILSFTQLTNLVILTPEQVQQFIDRLTEARAAAIAETSPKGKLS